jgi:iron complex outermembrane receptor protein
VRVFGQNLADENNVVGAYNTDPSSGLFTNGFFVEPRLYGATFGYRM